MNLVERRLKGAVFLGVAEAFDTVWVDGLAYKLMALKFPSYLVKTIQPTCEVGRLKRSSKRLLPLAVACGLAWYKGD